MTVATWKGIRQWWTDGAAHVLVTGGFLGPEGEVGLAPIDIGAASAASPAITGSHIDVVAEEDCYIAIAGAPVATTSSYFLPANNIVRFPITSGNKVAVLERAAVASKLLHIHPVS